MSRSVVIYSSQAAIALANREKALGPEHPDVAQGLENYAALLRKTGRITGAAKMKARAKAIRAKHAR